jgi:hypothetical protein
MSRVPGSCGIEEAVHLDFTLEVYILFMGKTEGFDDELEIVLHFKIF